MSVLKCQKIEDLFDEYLNKQLADEDMLRVERHLAGCERCERSLALWTGFIETAGKSELEPLPPLVERQLVIAAAARRGPRPKSVNWKKWALVSTAAAATAVIALIFVLGVPRTDSDSQSTQLAVQTEPQPRGKGRIDSPKYKERVKSQRFVKTHKGGRRVIPVAPGTNLWLDKDAVVHVVSIRSDIAMFRLERGRVVAEVKAPRPGYRFIVATPNGDVEAKGTIFSVEIAHDGRETARVIRGVVEVRKRIGKEGQVKAPVLLHAGEQASVSDPVPTQADKATLALDECLVNGCSPKDESWSEVRESDTATQVALLTKAETDTDRQSGVLSLRKKRDHRLKDLARDSDDTMKTNKESHGGHQSNNYVDTLVSLAQAKRKAGMYPVAAETYRRLIREFPDSHVAQNAIVSLGQLELVELGRPQKALTLFKKYLINAPNGFLAQEARLGQVRAYNRLGYADGVVRAATEYLKVHPGGYAGAEVIGRRSDARVKLDDCKGAIEDFHSLKTRWPNSKEIKRAAKGLIDCNSKQ